jgi:hypothetical protein
MPELPPRRRDRVVHTPGPPARYINAEPRPVRWRTSGEYVFATTLIAGPCVYRLRPMLEAFTLNGRQQAIAAIMREPAGGENFGWTLKSKGISHDDAEAGDPVRRSNNYNQWIKADYVWQNEEWHRERHPGWVPRGKVWWKQPTGQPTGEVATANRQDHRHRGDNQPQRLRVEAGRDRRVTSKRTAQRRAAKKAARNWLPLS